MADVIFTLRAKDVGLSALILELQERTRRLNAEFKKTGEGTEEYQKLAAEIGDTKDQTKQLQDQQKQLNRELNAAKFPKDSYIGLQQQYSQITRRINELSAAQRNSDFGKNLAAQGLKIKSELNSIEESLGRFTGSVGNYRKGLISIADLFTGGIITGGAIVAVQQLIALGKKAIDVNAQIEDSLADVAKTTGLTVNQVRDLTDSLSLRDTRTSLADQLGIAQIGGSLGVANDQLFSFVSSVDQLNVALGDQFGGNVEQTTDVLGKLRNVLTDLKTDQVGDDLLRIGNALNILESEGAASAGVISDFAGRIAGVGRGLGLASGQIIGISATLDELGVTAERGGTAVTSILQRLARSPQAFAEAIGEPVDTFTDLVNNDIGAALDLFLEKLNGQELSNNELAVTLQRLQLSGSGVSEVVSKLGGNLDLLRQRSGQATKALEGTNSITEEYEKKNNTLGASINKLQNALLELLRDGGPTTVFFQGLVDSVTDFVRALDENLDLIFDFTAAVGGAARGQTLLNESLDSGLESYAKESVAIERNINILQSSNTTKEQQKKAVAELTAAYPGLISQYDLENASITELNDIQNLYTENLARQINERSRARFLEAIDAEIAAQRIRKVELEITPDAELQKKLTIGERIRTLSAVNVAEALVNPLSVFTGGVTERNPEKVREQLLKDADKAERQLIEKRKAGERLFDEAITQNTQRTAQALQDVGRSRYEAEREALEEGIIPSLNRTGSAAQDAASGVDDLDESISDAAESGTRGAASIGRGLKGTQDEAQAAAGSIRQLEAEIAKLRERQENAPPELLPGVTKELIDAEARLERVRKRIEEIRNGPTQEAAPTQEQIIKTELDIKADEVQQAVNDAVLGIRAPDIPVNVVVTEDGITDIEQRFAQAAFDIGEQAALLGSRVESEVSDNLQGAAQGLDTFSREESERLERERVERLEKSKETQEQFTQIALDAALNLSNTVTEIERSRLEKETDNRLEALNTEEEKALEAVKGNAKKEEKVRAEFEKKRLEIEKEAAEERKKIAVKEAIIAGALAVIRALATGNFAEAIAVGIATALQLVTIQETEFAKGGFTVPGEHKSDGGALVQFVPGEMAKYIPKAAGGHTAQKTRSGVPVDGKAKPGFTGAGKYGKDATGRAVTGAYQAGGNVIVHHEGEYIAPHTQINRHPELFNWLEWERKTYGLPFAVGGPVAGQSIKKSAPPVSKLFAPGSVFEPAVESERSMAITVDANASFTDRQVSNLSDTIAVQVSNLTAVEVRRALAEGLQDADRRLERLEAANNKRSI